MDDLLSMTLNVMIYGNNRKKGYNCVDRGGEDTSDREQ